MGIYRTGGYSYPVIVSAGGSEDYYMISYNQGWGSAKPSHLKRPATVILLGETLDAGLPVLDEWRLAGPNAGGFNHGNNKSNWLYADGHVETAVYPSHAMGFRSIPDGSFPLDQWAPGLASKYTNGGFPEFDTKCLK